MKRKVSLKKADHPTYALQDVTDIVGFRFVCHFQSDVEKVVRLVLDLVKDGRLLGRLLEKPRLYTTKAHNQETLKVSLENLFRQFRYKLKHEEKDSRYTSVHLLSKTADGNFPIEIQVRNVFEDAWSEIEHALKFKTERTVAPGVENHLKVLNSLTQACTEYAETIFSDVKKESPERASIFPMTSDRLEYPAFIRRVMQESESLQQKGKQLEAARLGEAFIQKNQQKIAANREADYFLRMEIALSHLLRGDTQTAIEHYNLLLKSRLNRALIYYRLADAFRGAGDYRRSLNFLDLCQGKLRAKENTKQEVSWLQGKIPLKKAYVLWKLGSTEQALSELRVSYNKIRKAGNAELELTFVNSLCYYETEISWKRSSAKKANLRHWKSEFERLGLHSIKTSGPESVDTYAWLCFILGEELAAVQAAKEVQSCLRFKKDEIHPIVVWKGRPRPIAQSDVDLIRQHIGLISQMRHKTLTNNRI